MLVRSGAIPLTLYWKSLERLRLPFERRMEAPVSQVLAQIRASCVSQLERGNIDLASTIRSGFTPLYAVYRSFYSQIIAEFGNRSFGHFEKANFNPAIQPIRVWIDTQTGLRISRVEEVTVRNVRRIVNRAMLDGLGMDGAAKLIGADPAILSRGRGYRIARTEVVAASNAGTHYGAVQALGKRSGAFDKGWFSSRDERVRETHTRADAMWVPMHEPFKLPGGSLMFPGDSSLGASASEIVMCFPGSTEVAFDSHVLAATRHWYDGLMIRVTTKSGRSLAGTPNHPVLTSRGWVALKDLVSTDNLFSRRRGEIGFASPNVNNKPAFIEEVFSSLSIARGAQRVPAVSVNFHGYRPTCDVDVVLANFEEQHYSATDMSSQNFVYPNWVDAGGGVDSGYGLPPFVQRDNLLLLERFEFVGYVYNTQTSSGYYYANGLIVHNCRCTVQYRLGKRGAKSFRGARHRL